jgi:hypothetical protein
MEHGIAGFIGGLLVTFALQLRQLVVVVGTEQLLDRLVNTYIPIPSSSETASSKHLLPSCNLRSFFLVLACFAILFCSLLIRFGMLREYCAW